MTLLTLLAGTLAALLVATAAGLILRRTVTSERGRATVVNMNLRIATWWVLCGLTAAALLAGRAAVCLLFAIVSSLALREFITLTPTHRRDHRALFWSFFVWSPLQYWLVWSRYVELALILVPVCAVVLIPARIAIAGQRERLFQRSAAIFVGLMLCTYALSHIPLLLTLELSGAPGGSAALLFYFLLVVQASDVLQWIWGKLAGRTPAVPRISPNKTWEGYAGGVLSAVALGTLLHRATPFSAASAALISTLITLLGVAGGLMMSAIKRSRGAKDSGAILVGHGGILDRIDSLCLSAPVFFHVVKWLYAA